MRVGTGFEQSLDHFGTVALHSAHQRGAPLGVASIHRRALERGVETALYIEEMFSTGHDAANRAVFSEFSPEAARVVGTPFQQKAAFITASRYLKNRITAFLALPLATIDRMALTSHLRDIGRLDGATAKAGETK